MFLFPLVTARHPLYLFLPLQSRGLAHKELSVCSDLCLTVLSVLFLEEWCVLLCVPPQVEGGVSSAQIFSCLLITVCWTSHVNVIECALWKQEN